VTAAPTPWAEAPDSNVAPVLEVEDLCVTFRTESGTVSAVDHVRLSLGQGEIVGVVGESGCG
jgi:peptide/nickel transport system ATP-binding protein